MNTNTIATWHRRLSWLTPQLAVSGDLPLDMDDAEAKLDEWRQAGITHILDLRGGKMGLFVEEFDVRTLLYEIVSMVQPLLKQNSNVLEFLGDEDLGTMKSDQTKIRQCLFNLLSNAGKFCENGHLQLRASREKQNGTDWIMFSVRDFGIGMSNEQLKKVFDAFTQAEDTTTRKYGGTGLGLTITKNYCQMLGGNLSVESELGKGSLFTIRVPANVEKDNIRNSQTELFRQNFNSFDTESTGERQ